MKKPETVCITPSQVESMAVAIWGTDWRTHILPYLGISYSQLHRYMTIYGGQSIPRPVALAMHYAHDAIKADKPVPTLPTIPASESIAVKFKAIKKEKPVRVNNDAPEIDIFATAPAKQPEKPVEEPKAETPAPAPEKPKAAPKAAAKPKEPAKAKAPAKPKAEPKAKAPAKVKETVAKAKAAPAKPAEKKKPVRRAPVTKA